MSPAELLSLLEQVSRMLCAGMLLTHTPHTQRFSVPDLVGANVSRDDAQRHRLMRQLPVQMKVLCV
jgi:hypothetical protein